MAYSHCHTRIIDLKSLDIPEKASDFVYRGIYKDCIDSRRPESQLLNNRNLRDAIESVKYGIAPPVAFPTETVYGLGADATSEPAVAEIFAAKGRPSDNPLIVHISSIKHLERVIKQPLPEVYQPLVERYWPGPLTILLPVPEATKFAKNVHPGQRTIGFRMPSSKYARFFIAACDRPIAGPSANSSGKPSPTTAQHVMEDMKGKINFILDGGGCEVGVESTVVDGLHDPPLVLRPGGISLKQLQELGGKWTDVSVGYKSHSSPSTPTEDQYVEEMNGAPRAPGMKYRHYAPRAKLILFSKEASGNGQIFQYLSALKERHMHKSTLRVGILQCRWKKFAGLPADSHPVLSHRFANLESRKVFSDRLSLGGLRNEQSRAPSCELVNVSLGPSIQVLAHDLFGALRMLDELECDYIFAEAVESEGSIEGDHLLTAAVRDRIQKAATQIVDE